jgi:hypothetical protein
MMMSYKGRHRQLSQDQLVLLRADKAERDQKDAELAFFEIVLSPDYGNEDADE